MKCSATKVVPLLLVAPLLDGAVGSRRDRWTRCALAAARCGVARCDALLSWAGILEGSIAVPVGGVISAGGRAARLLASHARAVTPEPYSKPVDAYGPTHFENAALRHLRGVRTFPSYSQVCA